MLDKTIELAENNYDLRKKFDFRKIKINRKYEPDIPLVYCEKSKIQQVLFNLVKNASEAITLKDMENEVPELIFRLKSGQSNAWIEVEDNGIDMEEDIRHRVFEPFFTTKSVDKGTGLGLSVSYFIVVEDHGGQMEVVSTLGKGTRFIIKLPFRSKYTHTII